MEENEDYERLFYCWFCDDKLSTSTGWRIELRPEPMPPEIAKAADENFMDLIDDKDE